MMAFSRLVDALAQDANQMQMRQATVISVEAGCTCTLDVAGTTMTGVRYMSPPRPGTSCWVSWQGGAPMVIGQIADMYGPPASTAISNAAVSHPTSGVWVNMPSGGPATWDSDAWAMIAADGTFTAPCDGMWQFNASVGFANNATGIRGARIIVSSTTVISQTLVNTINGTQTVVSCSAMVGLGKGVNVVGQGFHTAGAALNMTHQQFSVGWISG